MQDKQRSVDSVSEAAADAAPVFARSVRLLTLGGLWLPPESAPEAGRQLYAKYSLCMGVFTLVNVLGEAGGMVFVDAPMPVRANNLISTLWRFLALAIFHQSLAHVRSLQALRAEAERMARMRHGDHGFGVVEHNVAALQKRARLVVNRLVLAYICWFTYSSTGVVTTPAVDWMASGVRPSPFMASKFWLLSEPDTPAKEVVMALSQAVSQYTCTVINVGYITFWGGLTIFLSFQARILGVLVRSIPFRASTAGPTSEKMVKKRLVHCITLQQDILNAAEEVNNAVRAFILILFLVSLCFIGVMLFLISGAGGANGVLMATLMILICTNCLVGISTYSSDQLRTMNEEVVHDVMATDWSSATPALQRLVYIMLMRATKPPSLWCWRAFRVGLPTWLQVTHLHIVHLSFLKNKQECPQHTCDFSSPFHIL
ncbi:uncharacterized protein LOC117642959 [Thrips palmi]|uniref:Odorant receptor n=1 Tax=Thrips palmi TaxID=161013 RepID=A0A6P8YTT0_THRPL|nr:uncharacterized protein LOC117642959 [Thrips palmi]